MSLDVYLSYPDLPEPSQRSNIFIRENGSTRMISREEWDMRFPGVEPWAVSESETNVVYQANITHNLVAMAKKAGLYDCLWRPDEHGYELAADLIVHLAYGLKSLRSDPEYFKTFNPQNGWGTYDQLVAFVSDYLVACVRFPDATVEVSR